MYTGDEIDISYSKKKKKMTVTFPPTRKEGKRRSDNIGRSKPVFMGLGAHHTWTPNVRAPPPNKFSTLSMALKGRFLLVDSPTLPPPL
ncbi:hypothetical protein QJS04_geneDACA005225 [Acorus gramineus]|uniref:Uncharacterized protein n=1 Tax=Acorus gramineus TaxID=55184 RepID=A0AAV9AUP3_ACOGR|nr:hypothetical protein QJS04_geneDACA005225 [Acorus gramineus]